MSVFTIVVLVCSLSQGACLQVAPKTVLNNKLVCEANVQEFENTFNKQNTDKDTVVVARCINWGTNS